MVPRSLVPLLLLTAALAGCDARVEDTRPGQPVKHRQDAFKAMLRAFEPVGLMLHDEQYSPERMAKLAEALALTEDAPWAYFGPDTDYPPSQSRPDVWSQPEAFAAERQRFLAASATLRAAGSLEATQSAYNDARARCKACHDAFRR